MTYRCERCKRDWDDSAAEENDFTCTKKCGGHVTRIPDGAVAVDTDPTEHLPSVLAVVLRAYQTESHPVMRLHRLCDACEVLARFLSLVSWADLHALLGEKLPDRLVSAMAAQIERPTFGMWARMLGSLSKEGLQLPGLVVPELAPFALEVLLPRLGSGDGDPRLEVIALRNLVFHSGGITHDAARAFLDAHENTVNQVWSQASFLDQLTVAFTTGERLTILRGSRATFIEQEAPECLRGWLGQREKRVVLLRDERGLNLWPLLDFNRARVTTPGGERQAADSAPLVFFRSQPEFVVYSALWGELPFSQRPDVADEFRTLFRLSEQRRRTGTEVVADFVDEIRADAEQLVGRREELAALKTAVKSHHSGVCWLAGSGGTGKSMIMARFAHDLSHAPASKLLVVAYRFRAGDSRCNRIPFLRLAVREIAAWLSQEDGVKRRLPPADDASGLLDQFEELLQDVAQGQRSRSSHERAPRKLIIAVDGLDEIARYDPEFPSLPFRHCPDNVLWVCAGRPGGELAHWFSAGRCVHVFPGGLPAMRSEDIRAMLVDGSGLLRYGLLARDHEENGDIHNDFLDAVVKNAAGLPLYACHLLRDIKHGEFTFADVGRLPPSMTAYYDDLLRRVSFSDLQAILTPLVTLIAWTEGPFTASGIEEFLVWREKIFEHGPEAAALVSKALVYVQGLLRVVPAMDGTTGYVPYHDTLRDYIRQSPHTQNEGKLTRRSLVRAAACWREFRPDGAVRAYLLRHGVAHLIDGACFAAAVELVHHLLGHPDERRDVLKAEIAQMVRFLALNLARSTPEEARNISPEHLMEVILHIDDQYEVFLQPMHLLRRHHRMEWVGVEESVLASGNWELMYATSLVMAQAWLEDPTPPARAHIIELAHSGSLSRRELGLYGLKLIAVQCTSRQLDPELLGPFLEDDSLNRRMLLGELLLTVALQGRDVIPIVESAKLLDSPWSYHRTQAEDIIATQCLVGKMDSSACAGRPGVIRAFAELEQTATLRQQLLAMNPVCANDTLRRLIADYFELPTRLQLIRQAEPSIGESPAAADIALLLFSHPSWEVREAAAVAVGSLWSFRKDLHAFLQSCIRHPNWRVRYAGMEVALAVTGADAGKLCEEALHCHAFDSSSWVRGLCSGSLGAWVLRREPRLRQARISQFQNELKALVCDSDFWPLVDMQWYLSSLATEGCDITPFVEAAKAGLLGQIDGWLTMGREELHHALDRMVRQVSRANPASRNSVPIMV